MKNSMKKAMAICVLAAVALSGFGCSKKGTDSEMTVETISLEQTKQDLTFEFGTNKNKTTQPAEDATEAKEDSTTAADDADASTTAAFEEVTQVVNVTDDDGHGVTDAEGEPVTAFTVIATRPAQTQAQDNNNTGSGSNSSTTAAAAPTEAATTAYQPAYDTCKAYWLDMSQQSDYVFNGEFLTLTFEVNKDAPDGSYPVTIATTDIASWDLVRYTPVIVDGEVAVNIPTVAQDAAPANDFALKVNSQSAKPGETVTMTIDLSNNPGFCAFVIDIQYDTNALTIVEASGGKDFDAAVHLN